MADEPTANPTPPEPAGAGGAAVTAHPERSALQQLLQKVEAAPQQVVGIFASSPEALIAFDSRRQILHANRGAEALFGYGPGALVGNSTDVLVPARLRQPDAPPMVATADVMQVHLPGLCADGSELPIEWAFGSVRTPTGPLFVMTVRNRADADRALEALRASEERFRLLVESVREYAIFMLDPSGRVSSWNRGAERSKGWSAAEITGQPYEVFFTPEDRAAGTPQRLLAAAVREGHQEISGWRVRKDGSRFFANAYLTALRSPSGELRGFAKITRDLTERLRAEEYERKLIAERAAREAAEEAEQRVRRSEERLSQLQRVTAALSEAATPLEVAAVVLDQSLAALSATGGAIYLLSADGTALELLDQRGHPEGPMAQHRQLQLAAGGPLSDAARLRSARFFRNFEECAASYPQLRELIRLGGFEASAALPLLTHGALLGVLGVRFKGERPFEEADRAVLLTLSELCAQALERARLFSAESKARAEAEAANRSKDEFLAMLGHELRNPLAPIVTAVHLMNQRGGDVLLKERTVIERQITHLQRLVDDLLDVSRIAQGKITLSLQHLDLAEAVFRAVEMASPLLESKSHKLTLRVQRGLFFVNGDAVRLAQVFGNLLTNAAKYTPPHGHVELTAAREGQSVVVRVRDDGRGIVADFIPRVFDLFAQSRRELDRNEGGLGLGLAVVKNLTALHGGSVEARSEGPGRGSEFTVRLPAAGAGVGEEPPAPLAPQPRISGRRVLVVDDNVDAAELLAEALELSGHRVTVAHDGPEALRLQAQFLPDVAVLDIGLPVMDGYELAERMRRAAQGPLRLIALTGYGQASDFARTRQAGFDAHLVKPVEVTKLQAALEEPAGPQAATAR